MDAVTEGAAIARSTSPVSAIEAIEKAMEGVTPGPWEVWEEKTPTKAEAVAEMAYQVENSEPFAEAVYLLNANGKCPATTGCGPTSAANAAYIAACSPDRMREVLALARQAEALQRENAELRAFAASFKFTCVEVSFYKDCYLHIIEPDSVSFRLNNGSQFSQFVAKLEDRRARALLGGENAGN